MIVFGVILLSLFFRLRGGFIPVGSTQLARIIFWALPVLWFSHSALSAVGAFLGLLIPHGSVFGRGVVNNLLMGCVGAARCTLIVAPFALHNPWILLLGCIGLLSGVASFVCWKYLDGIDTGISWKGRENLAKGATEWRELFDGAMYGVAVVAARYFYGG